MIYIIVCQSSSRHHSADGDAGPEGGGQHPRPDLPRAVAGHVVALVGAVAVLVAFVAVTVAPVDLVLQSGYRVTHQVRKWVGWTLI